MSEKIYNKLVRGKIPDIIRANGETPHVRTLEGEEFVKESLRKIIEEARELLENPCKEELADLKEASKAFADAMGWTEDEIEAVRVQKAAERGDFSDRIFLEKTT